MYLKKFILNTNIEELKSTIEMIEQEGNKVAEMYEKITDLRKEVAKVCGEKTRFYKDLSKHRRELRYSYKNGARDMIEAFHNANEMLKKAYNE